MGIFDNISDRKYRYKVLTEFIYDDKALQELLNDQGDMRWRTINLSYERTTDLEDNPCRLYRIVLESAYYKKK